MVFLPFLLTSPTAERYRSRVAVILAKCSMAVAVSFFGCLMARKWVFNILVERARVAQFTIFLAYILSAMGLAILVVWPEGGPGAFVREKLFRKLLPKPTHGVLDCYICSGFWTGLLLSIPWWFMYRQGWIWFGCLMIPAVFWLVTGKWK